MNSTGADFINYSYADMYADMVMPQNLLNLKYAVAGFVVALCASALLFSNPTARAVGSTDTTGSSAGGRGALLVLADPTDLTQCKSGAWRSHRFKSQGQCFQFVNTGIDARTNLAQ
jgi:hypothetical protein